jgi:adenylate cyclase
LSIAIILSLNRNLDYVNGRIYDLLFNIYRGNPEHCDNVVIACIDQKSIDYFEENVGYGWPWPRSFHGLLVEYLTDCKARAIVFDVLFSEPDMNRGEEDNDSEQSNKRYYKKKPGLKKIQFSI